jgi:ATP-dependent RNA helicase SUPV3L1/SUV3
VSHRGEWLRHAREWQERSRALEDRLSDALHAALTQRFVDRRTAVLYRSLKERRELFGAVSADGDVLVEGQYVGRLRGLRFEPDAAANGDGGRALRTAANRVLAREIGKRAAHLANADDGEIDWRDDNSLWWRGAPVARLARGASILQPRIDLLPADHLDGVLRERVRQRLTDWVGARIRRDLRPLLDLASHDLSGPGRGIVFQLTENLGQMPRRAAEGLLANLGRADRQNLRRHGVRIGYLDLFVPALLRPGRTQLRLRLWAAHNDMTNWPDPPAPGLVSFACDKRNADDSHLAVCGFHRFGRRALRIDIADRVAKLAHQLSRKGAFEISPDMLAVSGCGADDLHHVLRALGYAVKTRKDKPRLYRYRPDRPQRRAGKADPGRSDVPASPFAALQSLKRNRNA